MLTPCLCVSTVKSENDRLSETQRMWIHVLTSAGVRVELCAARDIKKKEQQQQQQQKQDNKKKGKKEKKEGASGANTNSNITP